MSGSPSSSSRGSLRNPLDFHIKPLADWHDLHLAVLFPPTFQLEPDEILANHRGLIETFAA
jgi:hypothetical protein